MDFDRWVQNVGSPRLPTPVFDVSCSEAPDRWNRANLWNMWNIGCYACTQVLAIKGQLFMEFQNVSKVSPAHIPIDVMAYMGVRHLRRSKL